ncbi:hypothetical protein LSH36_905g00006 [Paralvinella palmiformis]|uniref:Uncharacterized protein n=1 Tax=Paralvinella palmiformis TaxID=53620 RepID=A0AAD9MRJ6_9ANNE|nr:hypothetical protein LSH36_905g00006 [Paralvinella palmiformis]
MGKEKKRKAAAFKCQYDEKSVKWQPCDPKTKKQKKIIPLTKHQPKRCPSEKILTRDCVNVKEEKKKIADVTCQYDEIAVKWQPCNPKTKKQKKIIPLKKDQPKTCPSSKTLTRDCVKDKEEKKKATHLKCQYDEKSVKWQPCDPKTKTQEKIIPLKKDQPKACPPNETLTRYCVKDKEEKKKATHLKCQYDEKSVKWQPCDPKTKTQEKIIPLKKDQPKACPPNETLTRYCVKGRT